MKLGAAIDHLASIDVAEPLEAVRALRARDVASTAEKRGPGRPPSDGILRVEQIARVLHAEPDASANAIYRVVRGRRGDVLRVVTALRPG